MRFHENIKTIKIVNMKRYRGREPEKLSRLSECSRQHVLGEVESGMGRTGGENGGRGDDLAP